MIATDVVTRCSAAAGFNYISLNSDTPHSLSRQLPPAARTEQWETLAENQAAVHSYGVQGAAIVHSITDQSQARRRYKNI